MRFHQAVFLACISKTIAGPFAPDFSIFSPTDSDNPDGGALSSVDSDFVATANLRNSGSSDSNSENLDNFGLDNQNNELNIGYISNSIAPVKAEISKTDCSSSGIASNGLLQKQECSVSPSATDQTKIEEEDEEDAQWVEEHFKNWAEAHPDQAIDVDSIARQLCSFVVNPRVVLQLLPLCCRGPARFFGVPPNDTPAQENCVAYIEGRPRCRPIGDRFCCWILGLGDAWPTLGYDCRSMIPTPPDWSPKQRRDAARLPAVGRLKDRSRLELDM